ncbi:hypothetical protein D3C85_868800 [compost metagenome]
MVYRSQVFNGIEQNGFLKCNQGSRCVLWVGKKVLDSRNCIFLIEIGIGNQISRKRHAIIFQRIDVTVKTIVGKIDHFWSAQISYFFMPTVN